MHSQFSFVVQVQISNGQRTREVCPYCLTNNIFPYRHISTKNVNTSLSSFRNSVFKKKIGRILGQCFYSSLIWPSCTVYIGSGHKYGKWSYMVYETTSLSPPLIIQKSCNSIYHNWKTLNNFVTEGVYYIRVYSVYYKNQSPWPSVERNASSFIYVIFCFQALLGPIK